MHEAVIFNNVSYSYPESDNPVIRNINLSIEQGEFLAVLGENNSGKSTFCKLINGIIPHVHGGNLDGTVAVFGECTKKASVPALALKAGLVLDDPDSQLFTSTVKTEAAFGPENLLVPPKEIEARVSAALSAVGLKGMEDRLVTTLSGGEKQRLAIASFLTMDSRILVLDEPLCRLDPEGAGHVMSVLNQLKIKYGKTIIITASSCNMIKEYADRVCVLKNGSIAALNDTKKILFDNTLLEENGIHGFINDDISSVFTDKNRVADNSAALPAIQLKDFSFSYKNGLSIKNINLSIYDNDFAAIIGSNGCGKTTLLKNITGLLKPDSGDIFIRGKNIKHMTVSEISGEAGYVMQNPDVQLFTDSVFNEISFALKKTGLSESEIKMKTKAVMNTVDLTEGDSFPHSLNLADRTKVVIACVLAMGSKIIIFDEVDTGQDYKGIKKIMGVAQNLHSMGFTILFVTHNMHLVCRYAHRLIIMEKDGIITEWKK